jgi:branched-chain amino acid transport system permease protein
MIKRAIKNHLNLTVSIIVVVICALIPLFVRSPYYLDLFIIIIVNTILGITFLLQLRTGLINLGIAAFWGIGAYTSALLVMNFGLSFWLSLPISAFVGGILAMGLGYILIGSKNTGFTFVMLSAVIGLLFTVVLGSISYVGGHNGITDIPQPNAITIPFLPAVEFDSKVPFFYLALFLFLIIVILCRALYSSWIGRAWTAVGLNPRLAESLGVDVFKYRLLGFIVASAIASLTGSFFAHYAGFISPQTFGIWQSINVQIYAILGGLGHAILGPLIGSMVMILIPEALRVTYLIAPIITGLVILLVVLFFPHGLLGLFEHRIVVERFARIRKALASIRSGKRGEKRYDTSD